MVEAVRVHKLGGPEVLTYETIESRPPGAGEIRIRTTAIGVNFIDVYFRNGLYAAETPFIAGKEAAGVVEEVGDGVTEFRVGDRVASAALPGSYATELTAPAAVFVKVPDGISDETAAAMMLKGMTACYLLRRTFRVGPEHIILFHAASGGVGSIATQWAKHLGATVIGTVGSEEKAKLAKRNGVDHTILYRTEDFVQRVAEITGGAKCDVVYDFGWPADLERVSRLPEAARTVCTVRQFVGCGDRLQSRSSRPEGFAVHDPADFVRLHRQA